jgi:hypothetical protein
MKIEYNFNLLKIINRFVSKVKMSLLQAMEAPRVAKGRDTHIS